MYNSSNHPKRVPTVLTDSHLTFWANVAAIGGFIVTLIGAIVGISGYIRYRRTWKAKTEALVGYLKYQKIHAVDGKKGQQTTTHLIRHLGLTEDEILRISFERKNIQRTTGKDDEGKAITLFFEYKK